MTSVMLATYPDTFAAGGVVAGLPYHAATNMEEALDCMSKARDRSPREWGDLVRAASSHRGPWPGVSVWHGSVDPSVRWENAVEIVDQWTDMQGLIRR
jgi:poly(hydroxyalkanoate) depolymerase family esterase